MKANTIYNGNNIDVLKTFPDNSIDSIVTDPPYGLGKEPNAIEVLRSWITTGYHEITGKGFMGKEWDSFVPQPLFWKEVYRVLKPGGHVLSFAGTRTYDWMVMAIRLAGFEIRDMVAWVYGSGFPKSLDVSKAIDNKLGIEREVIGKNPNARETVGNINICKKNGSGTITAPSTDKAKQWQGWGSSLKPSIEPVVLARKPLDGTIAENVLKWGTGALNIDGCRVGKDIIPEQKRGNSVATDFMSGGFTEEHIGRFPANFIHDGSEEVLAMFPNTTPSSSGGISSGRNFGQNYDDNNEKTLLRTGHDDNGGSAARFFYTAKTSQQERNMGLYEFEEKETRGGGGRAEQGYDDFDEEEQRLKKTAQAFGAVKAKKKNIHPTVKPIDLMRYLVRLVTPPNGIVLDPFLGSGTTAIAAKLEDFQYIGIELELEYCAIAKARVASCQEDYVTKAKLLENPEVKEVFTIFDMGAGE